ncbi:DUF6232 family protein [Actinoplanes sp. TFC3]|uniref:DUF6232 family protein n=1 Tax=Actinoplanes sp. TFC3 TaxID=1710355 RepID=UPI000835E899|nr:DUF6232 family protein [Actinoplanes sp. TFC3]
MRIYYRSYDAVVTSDYFISRSPATTRAFLVQDLRDACIIQPRSGLAAACATLFLRAEPQPWLLEATYHGDQVTLYESTDARVFSQVSRALRRAMEDGRPPRASNGLSAA